MIARLLAVAAALAVGAGLLLAPGGPAHAQAPAAPVQVSVTLGQPTALLGERVHLTVIAAHPSDLLVTVELQSIRSELRVIEALPEVRLPAGGRNSTTRFEYVLAGFALGEMRPDVFRISWLQGDGVSGEVPVETPAFEVRPTLSASADAGADIRPLKPQASVEGGPPAWQRPVLTALAAALVLAVLVVAAFAVRRLVRRRRALAPVPVAEATIEARSRRRLDELATADALSSGGYDAYYGELSSVVREYLADRFEFGATALTTTELERRMTAQGVERWQARLVGGLLERCDAAVYAGRRPDPASADHDLTVAYEIIELTNPANAEPEPVEVAS